jgi:hypothetical protein
LNPIIAADKSKIPLIEQKFFARDAFYLAAMDDYSAQQNQKPASLSISTCHQEHYYNAIMHLYHSKGHCRDFVFSRFHMHADGFYEIIRLEIFVENRPNWVALWKKKRLLTGQSDVDRFIRKYKISKIDVRSCSKSSCTTYWWLSHPLKTWMMAKEINTLPGLSTKGYRPYSSSFMHHAAHWMYGTIAKDLTYITYSYRYNDCIMGCTSQFNLHFEINENGSARVLGYTGRKLNYTSSKKDSFHHPDD